MCCTFNMHKADEIFKESQYLKNVVKLQARGKNNSFGISALPSWYTDKKEPRCVLGDGKWTKNLEK